MPTHLEMGVGFFRKNPTIKFDLSIDKHDQKWLEESARALFPIPGGNGTFEFKLDPRVDGEEAYRLEVAPSRIEVEASNPKGLYWSIQTLRQLQTPQGIPYVRIDDAPKFGWRGVFARRGKALRGESTLGGYPPVHSSSNMRCSASQAREARIAQLAPNRRASVVGLA